LLLGALLLGHTAARAQDGTWVALPNAPTLGLARHDDVTFVDEDTGWVINFRCLIFHTNDGGDTWTQQYQNGPRFRSVGFANDQVGWVGSLDAHQVLYETRDGGQTWSNITNRISGVNPGGICGLWVVNDQVVYAVGAYSGTPRFIKSIDGGQTWTSRDMSVHIQTLVDVYFMDEQRGFALGGNNTDLGHAAAVVLMTTDGGSTWTKRFTSTRSGEWGWKLSFPTPDVGYASTEFFNGEYTDAKVLKTTDGGLTWQEILIPGSTALQGIGFISEDVGWASGRGIASETEDGGTTWSSNGVLDGRVNRIRVLNEHLAYAVGSRVYKYTAEAVNLEEEPGLPMAFSLEQNYPNPFNPFTIIRYVLDEPAQVHLSVYDLRGRLIRTLENRHKGGGGYEVIWNGDDEAGQVVSSGVYFYRLSVDGEVETRRMVLTK
jgi:photosystem II stability/assembly factor-like uncharacterized protein